MKCLHTFLIQTKRSHLHYQFYDQNNVFFSNIERQSVNIWQEMKNFCRKKAHLNANCRQREAKRNIKKCKGEISLAEDAIKIRLFSRLDAKHKPLRRYIAETDGRKCDKIKINRFEKRHIGFISEGDQHTMKTPVYTHNEIIIEPRIM